MQRKLVGLLCTLMICVLPFSVSAMSSRSAAVLEVQSGRFLFEKDADTKRPMASTTKLMTALIAAKRLSMDAVVEIPRAALLVEGSSMGLRAGDTLTVRDLLYGLLLTSGNDAANAVALLCADSLPSFATLMNEQAAALGMTNTVFVTPSGLDEGEHGSTARDLCLLGAAVLAVPELREICSSKRHTVTVSGEQRTYTNHNRLLSLYEPTIGLKTGYTVKSGKCLVSAAQKNGVTLVAVTLNGGDYWHDHIALYEDAFSRARAASVPRPMLPPLAVAGGTASSVELTATLPPTVTVLDGETVTVTVERPPFVWAPLAQGDSVGTVRYRVGDRIVVEAPICAQKAVAEQPPLGFFIKWLKYIKRLLTE